MVSPNNLIRFQGTCRGKVKGHTYRSRLIYEILDTSISLVVVISEEPLKVWASNLVIVCNTIGRQCDYRIRNKEAKGQRS